MVKIMKKFLITVLGLSLLPMLFACKSKSTNEKPREDANEEADTKNEAFRLMAIVKSVGERLEVEVIESDYAFGEYWVIISPETEFLDKSGNKISVSDLKPEDKIEITYGGQVMMSYPPQIVAAKITVVD